MKEFQVTENFHIYYIIDRCQASHRLLTARLSPTGLSVLVCHHKMRGSSNWWLCPWAWLHFPRAVLQFESLPIKPHVFPPIFIGVSQTQRQKTESCCNRNQSPLVTKDLTVKGHTQSFPRSLLLTEGIRSLCQKFNQVWSRLRLCVLDS